MCIRDRDHIGGNLYCEDINGIHVHKYGAHIFHTNSRDIWDYVNRFAEFNRYTNSPIANYKGEIYNMPFNMNTFNKMWGVVTPEQARAKIAEQQAAVEGEPRNLEEQAIRLVGSDIYTKLVKGYTEKQWGRDCTQLPAFIIKRLPVRYTYDNNYFNDRYQGTVSYTHLQPIQAGMLETQFGEEQSLFLPLHVRDIGLQLGADGKHFGVFPGGQLFHLRKMRVTLRAAAGEICLAEVGGVNHRFGSQQGDGGEHGGLLRGAFDGAGGLALLQNGINPLEEIQLGLQPLIPLEGFGRPIDPPFQHLHVGEDELQVDGLDLSLIHICTINTIPGNGAKPPPKEGQRCV